MKEGVSVVICCYNSEKKIEKVLLHLSKQKGLDSIPYEIILVDNNSTDTTSLLAASYWRSLETNIPLKIVKQEIPGLNAAREKGIDSSENEFILLCDDDNWLDEHYISNAFRIMKGNERIGVLGGKSEAVFESIPPAWFSKFENQYAVGEQYSKDGNVNERGYLWGAGMILRKKAWNHIKEKSIRLISTDRLGTQLNSGGDSELSLLILNMGFDLWYSSELKFKHYITKERLNWNYLIKLQKGFGRSEARLYPLKIATHMKQGKLKNDYQLNVSRERNKVIKSLIRNPYKIYLTIINKEGSYVVLWFHFHFSYLKGIMKNRTSILSDFINYVKLFLV